MKVNNDIIQVDALFEPRTRKNKPKYLQFMLTIILMKKVKSGEDICFCRIEIDKGFMSVRFTNYLRSGYGILNLNLRWLW